VFGVPYNHWGEAVVAAVVFRAGRTPDTGGLGEHVKSLKGPVHAPKRFLVVDALPTTPLGKIDKTALRALAQQTPTA
jgi:fatty-acyl-CoA synthase